MLCATCHRDPLMVGFGAHQLIGSSAGHVARRDLCCCSCETLLVVQLKCMRLRREGCLGGGESMHESYEIPDTAVSHAENNFYLNVVVHLAETPPVFSKWLCVTTQDQWPWFGQVFGSSRPASLKLSHDEAVLMASGLQSFDFLPAVLLDSTAAPPPPPSKYHCCP